jgi:hypothetical protein
LLLLLLAELRNSKIFVGGSSNLGILLPSSKQVPVPLLLMQALQKVCPQAGSSRGMCMLESKGSLQRGQDEISSIVC